MNYTIERSKWLRGEGDSFLLRPSDSLMCCLGQVSLQCGVPESKLRGVSAHGELEAEYRGKLPEWLFDDPKKLSGSQSLHSFAAMQINDDEGAQDAAREEKLAALFAAHGDTLTFID